MNKFALFVASLLMSVTSFAQWTKPAAPAVAPLSTNQSCYLYNKDADGFFVGANDYGTRASVSQTSGYEVKIEQGTESDSYYISSYVLEGWMKNSWGYMFLDNFSAIYTDNTKEGKPNNQYTFVSQGDGTYKIGLSNKNSTFTATDYPTAFLGVNKAKKDTRLYFCDYENGDEQESDCQLVWYFVTPDDYTAYVASIIIYNAAMELGEQITIAKATVGVDADVLSASEALYNNTSSTAEAMTTQAQKLRDAIMAAAYYVASLDHPVEVLANQNIATDFSDEQTTGWTSTTNAQNKGAGNGNNAKDYSVTGNHYENWNDGAMSVGKVSATAVKLPAGVYRFEALAFTSTGAGLNLYAGAAQKPVTSTLIDIESPTEVYTYCGGGEMEIGLNLFAKGPNWIGLDNVQLYYLGDSDESYEKLLEEIMLLEPDYEALFDDEEACAQASVRATYTAAKNTVESAQTSQARAQAVDDFMAASKAMASSVAAYGAYKKVFDEATDFVSSTTSESAEVALLSDYIGDDEKEEGAYNGNGGALYILENALLNDEQITAELAYLNKLFLDAKANAKADGDDCTDLLQNPSFTADGGWQGKTNSSITWPAGKEDYRLVEVVNAVCDIYQNLDNLQNGLYEFTLQSAVRPDDGAYDEANVNAIKAHAYINDFKTPIPSGQIPDEVTLNSQEEASDAFAAGKFPVTVYGLVTEGKMKVGFSNELRVADGMRLWAGGAKLTFRGKNPEVLASVIASLTPVAQELLTQYAGSPELNALSDAIAEAASADDAYKALIAMKAAMDDVQEGVELYEKLKVALASLSAAIEENPSSSKVAAAQEILDAAQNAYDNKTYGNEKAEQAISDVNAAAVSVRMGDDTASEYNPTDCTNLIVNPTFDPAKGDKNTGVIEGWTTTAMNGYKQYSVSYNRAPFELNQKLTGLKKGKYRVTVHTYYRAGYWNEEESRIAAGAETHLTTLYAQTSEKKYTKPVLNLTEGAVAAADVPEGAGNTYTLTSGLIAPDGTTPTVAFFNAGYYLNTLEFFVGEDGEATIGLSKVNTFDNDYEVVGAWNLYYLGDQDCTSLIINPTFDPAKGDKNAGVIEGWTTTAMNGYKQYSVSYNRAPFELNQKLTGLKKGNYKVTVHTYYRAGYWNEEESRIAAGAETHLTTLYAQPSEKKYTKPVLNLTEGAVAAADVPEGAGNTYTLTSGLIAPDGTTPTVAFFNAGYYLNELEFTVGADGSVTIGLSKTQTYDNDYEVVGAWNLYYLGDPTPEEECTSLIVNPTFDPAKGDKNTGYIEGWTTTAMNGYKQYSVSYNRTPFELYQDLSGLEEGTYKVTVHTYYRAGYWYDEETHINNSEDTHLTTLYAQTSDKKFSKPVLNLTEGAVAAADVPEGSGNTYTLTSGLIAPDGTSPTVAFFNAGYYLNELEFVVPADGKVRIGLSKTKTYDNDYEVVGAWKLYYYPHGLPTDIEGVDVDESTVGDGIPVAFYSLSGTKLAAPQRGFNIVKYSNGLSKKVLIP